MPISDKDIMEVIYRYRVNAQICMTVLHYTADQNYPNADPISAADAMAAKLANPANNAFLQNMAAIQSNQVTYLDVSCQIIFPTRWLKSRADIALAGAIVGGCRAQNVAGVITKLTKFAARSGVGSVHVGGLPDTGYNAGVLTAQTLTGLNLAITGMLLSISEGSQSTTWNPSLANRTKVPNSDPPKFVVSGSTELYTAKPQLEVRTMRRRTVSIGI